jgi:hypothetical protein
MHSPLLFRIKAKGCHPSAFSDCAFRICLHPQGSSPNQELFMGKGNNSRKKEVKKPKKEKPKVLATRKSS